MSKMHLTAKVPNEGARRLAWWIGQRTGAGFEAYDDLARAIGSHVSFVDRVLAGEVVPGEELARLFGVATDGFVHRCDWRTPSAGGWFDEVECRMRKAA